VLTLVDLPQPSNYAAEGYRLLWTLCGAGIAVLVMLLAGLLAKVTTKATPQPASTHSGPAQSPPRTSPSSRRSGSGTSSPETETARLVVTSRLIAGLVVAGLAIKAIVGAIRQRRQRA
jgi:hypothetical protein